MLIDYIFMIKYVMILLEELVCVLFSKVGNQCVCLYVLTDLERKSKWCNQVSLTIITYLQNSNHFKASVFADKMDEFVLAFVV